MDKIKRKYKVKSNKEWIWVVSGHDQSTGSLVVSCCSYRQGLRDYYGLNLRAVIYWEEKWDAGMMAFLGQNLRWLSDDGVLVERVPLKDARRRNKRGNTANFLSTKNKSHGSPEKKHWQDDSSDGEHNIGY